MQTCGGPNLKNRQKLNSLVINFYNLNCIKKMTEIAQVNAILFILSRV
jgi:hypothetical protein